MDAKLRQRTSTTFAYFSLGWAAVLLSLLLWQGGCSGPTSVTSLRRHPAYVYSSEVPAACETVYERIARRAQERYRYTNRPTYQPGVTARIAPDGQSAAVTFFDAGGLNLRYVLTADLHALDPDHTEVRVCAAGRSTALEALLWQHWAATPLESPADPSAPPAAEKGPQDANDPRP